MIDKEKVISKLDDLRQFADAEIHPIVSPDNRDVYSKLCDLIDLTKTDVLSLLKKQEPKLVNVSENAYGYKFYNCPSCKSDFEMKRYDEPYMLPRYCDRCGQRVKFG